MADRNGTRPQGAYLGMGVGLGVAIGAALGVVMDNIPVGMGAGIAIGIALGLAIGAGKAKKDRGDKGTPKDDDPGSLGDGDRGGE